MLVPLVALYHDIQRSYITTSDADIVYVYEALLYNAGYPQNNYDHPGYIYFLILGWWFRLLRAALLLPAADFTAISALPPAAIEAAYAKLVIAGRTLSIIMSMAFVAAVFVAVRRWARDTVSATVAGTLFALSAGIAVQSSILRNELLSALCAFLAFVALVEAARARAGRGELWLMFVGLLSVLALTAKIQAVFVLLALPILLSALIVDPPVRAAADDLDEGGQRARVWLLVLLSVALAAPAAMMVLQTIRFRSGSVVPPVAIIAYIAGLMVLYAMYRHVSIARFTSAAAALVIGIALGLLSLLWRHNLDITKSIVLLVEHMTVFSRLGDGHTITFGAGELAGRLLEGMRTTAASRLRVGYSPLEGHRILELILAVAAVVAARAGHWRLGAQCVLVLGLSWALETAFSLRGMQNIYRIYIDPWLALTTGLVATVAFGGIARAYRWQRGLATALGVLVVLAFVGQAVDRDVVARQPADNACYQMAAVREPLATHFAQYCAAKPRPSSP